MVVELQEKLLLRNESLSLEKLNWDSQQGRDLATSGHNTQKL